MSRWATQRSAIEARLGHDSDVRRPRASDVRRPGRSMADQRSPALLAGPDLADAAEPERRRGVLVEVPIATADVRSAVVDSRGHQACAVAERDLGATRERAVRDAQPGVETAGGVAAVVVPGGLGEAVHGHLTGAGRRTAVQLVPGEADPNLLLAGAPGDVAQHESARGAGTRRAERVPRAALERLEAHPAASGARDARAADEARMAGEDVDGMPADANAGRDRDRHGRARRRAAAGARSCERR